MRTLAPACAGEAAERVGGIYQMFGINRAYRIGDWKLVRNRLALLRIRHPDELQL